MGKESCKTCEHRYKLIKLDYSSGHGCEHTAMEGFICMAFADEGEADWMYGITNGMCECYKERKNNIVRL